MKTNRVLTVFLALGLGLLMVIFVLAVTNLRSEVIYTPAQHQALVRSRQMNLVQSAPSSNFYQLVAGEMVAYDTLDSEGRVTGLVPAPVMGVSDCRVRAILDARYEEVDGITTTAYDLDFEGTYHLRAPSPEVTTTLELIFPFPHGLDTLNQVTFLVDNQEPPGARYNLTGITWYTEMAPGEEHEVVVRYRARGAGSFRYAIERNRRLDDLDVEIVVRGLTGSRVPDGSLPTTGVEPTEGGERFAWSYEKLIADRNIQVTLPERPSFIQRVEELRDSLVALSISSPLIVALFITCLAGMHRLSGVRLPFHHYLLAGCGLFLFYPALTFLTGVLELPLAAAIATVAITALLLVFLGRVAGGRRTWWQTVLLSGVFLGLFSLGAMSRWRGLLLTAGGLLLVAAFMLLVARQPARRSEEGGDDDENGPDGEARKEVGSRGVGSKTKSAPEEGEAGSEEEWTKGSGED